MAPKKGVLYKRLIRDFTISGLNPQFDDSMKKTSLPQTTDVIRFLAGAVSFFLLDYSHAYRQLRNADSQVRFHGYKNFGFLVLDLYLPFGRADSARIFQTVAHTIIQAFRIRMPALFTHSAEEIVRLKKFKYLQCTSEDL